MFREFSRYFHFPRDMSIFRHLETFFMSFKSLETFLKKQQGFTETFLTKKKETPSKPI